MSGSSSTISTRLDMAALSYQPRPGGAARALLGLGSVRARVTAGQEPQEAQPLAERIAVDPKEARSLELVARRELQRETQQRHLNAPHHRPVQPATFRGRRITHDAWE